MTFYCVFILLMMILACTHVLTHSIGTGMRDNPINGFEEYAEKPIGTIKTMKWQGPDLVDCVDIYKQPSMNHPLLKNHKIQDPNTIPPTSLINRFVSHSNLINVPENEKCPNGTIPIRRPFKNELVRATLPPSRNRNRSKVNEPPESVHKYAMVSLEFDAPRFVGISSAINVWKPTTNPETFSRAKLRIAHASHWFYHEVVEAGWMVNPAMFHDQEPRFYIFFTRDGYITKCYNLDCGGFVQVSPAVCLGCTLNPQSIYGGEQFEIDIGISQNANDKTWWIRFNNIFLGYYPGELFPKFTEAGATDVQWVGEVTQLPNQGPSPNQMGSGHFPEEGYEKASFFRDLKYEEANDMIITPVDDHVKKYASHPHCYGLSQLFGEDEGQLREPHFFYGGPGESAPGCDVGL